MKTPYLSLSLIIFPSLPVCCAEALPIFLAVIQEHRDAGSRDTLTHALFNLVKKPNASQRQLIVGACSELAGRIGPSRTAEELLPQGWEQARFPVCFGSCYMALPSAQALDSAILSWPSSKGLDSAFWPCPLHKPLPIKCCPWLNIKS